LNKIKEKKIPEDSWWYLIGLIAADGSLSKDGRHIDITAKDYDFLKEIKSEFFFSNKIGIKRKGEHTTHRLQIADKELYKALESIGLGENKSLTIGPLAISKEFFKDFLRGIIDGDGEIKRWIHPQNKKEQWCLRIRSGSKKFLEWLMGETELAFGAKGKLYKESKAVSDYRLKYGKMAAQAILRHCYSGKAIGLKRKRYMAQKCIASCRGWTKSKTILS